VSGTIQFGNVVLSPPGGEAELLLGENNILVRMPQYPYPSNFSRIYVEQLGFFLYWSGPAVNSVEEFYSMADSLNYTGASGSVYLSHTEPNQGHYAGASYSITVSTVPEPSTGLLVAAGLLVLGVRRRSSASDIPERSTW
jgi:hypothetical protein